MIVFLAGPTAAGKTEAAVYLAKKIGAEIVSADSMQIYKGMDIITSKPPRALRKKVPHHLISILSPEREYNVSRYRREALKKTREIIKRGRIPLFVGGTGLYMSILIDGIFREPRIDKAARRRLYEEAERNGSAYLHSRLEKIDPSAAGKIHPNDTKRIIRALEVFEAAGRPISELQKERKGLSADYEIKSFCLNMERDRLNKRIEARVDKMFRRGLLRETERLLKKRLSRTASYAIGIKELQDYFNGASSLEEAKEKIKRNTCLYAKRQLTWFRKDKRIQWINLSGSNEPEEIARKIWKKLSW